ncbi:MAG: helix-hairpin-helix domain-containing protein [Mycobacteriaceae bacterium]
MSATDRSSIARHRLDLLTAPAPTTAPDPGRRPSPCPRPHPEPQEPTPLEPEPQPAPGPEAGPAPGGTSTPPPHGWRERWLPESWCGARVDPGRRGSVALTGVAAAAAVLAAVGVWRERPVPQVAPPLPVVTAAAAVTSRAPVAAKAAGPIVVSVAGAVAKPGLVTLAAGARVADALAAAGGAVKGTSLLTVNLARALGDGEQVLIGVDDPPVSGSGSGGDTGAGASADALIDLNTAGEAELEKLPGVGPVMAAAIITHREDNGGFTRVEQLTDVPGIGDARFAQLKALVRV